MLERIHHPDRSSTTKHPTITPPVTARSANRLSILHLTTFTRFALLNLGFSFSHQFAALLGGMQLADVWNEQWHGRALWDKHDHRQKEKNHFNRHNRNRVGIFLDRGTN